MTQISNLPTLSVQIANVTASSFTSPFKVPYGGINNWQWLDITADVISHRTRRGKQHELDRFETGTLEVVLDNRLGQYTPFEQATKTYTKVSGGTVNVAPKSLAQPMTPIRVLATWNSTQYGVYTGFVDSWALNTPDEVNSQVTISASDGLKTLSTTRLLNPTIYPNNAVQPSGNSWNIASFCLVRCNEKSANTNILEDYFLGLHSATIYGQATYNVIGPHPYDPSTAIDLSNGTSSPSAFITWPDQNTGGVQGYIFYVSGWFQNAKVGDILCGNWQPDAYKYTYAQVGPSGHIYIYQSTLNTSGSPTITLVHGGAGGPPVNDGKWHHVGLIFNGVTGTSSGTVNAIVDGVTTGGNSATFQLHTPVVGWNVSGTQSSYLPAAATTANVADLAWRFAIAWPSGATPVTELQQTYRIGSLLTTTVVSGQRILETLQVAGLVPVTYGPTSGAAIPSGAWVDDGTNSGVPVNIAVGTQYVSGSASDSTQKLASEVVLTSSDTELGAFYTGTAGTYIFRNRFFWGDNYRSQYLAGTSPTVSDQTNLADSSYSRFINDIDMLQDDLDLWTAAQITDVAGVQYTPTINTDSNGLSSAEAQVRYGQRTIVRASYSADANTALEVGHALLWRHQVPQIRTNKVTLVAEAGDPTTTTMLSANLGDIVLFERRDAGTAAFSAPIAIESIQHEFKADPGQWHTTHTLSPFEITGAPYWRLGDANYGTFADAQFTTSAALTAGTTYTSIPIVPINPYTTTVNGTGFSGTSTSITVASTDNVPSTGTIQVTASGGFLNFSYTGTTATSFTGLSLVSGTASWTIANGATVSMITTAIGTNAVYVLNAGTAPEFITVAADVTVRANSISIQSFTPAYSYFSGLTVQVFTPANQTPPWTLNMNLTSGSSYTTLTVQPLSFDISANSAYTLVSGTHSQTVTVLTAASAGATTITVGAFGSNFTPTYSFPSGSVATSTSPVYVGRFGG